MLKRIRQWWQSRRVKWVRSGLDADGVTEHPKLVGDPEFDPPMKEPTRAERARVRSRHGYQSPD